MENIRLITLEHIKKGDIIYIDACSQCASKAKITLEGVNPTIELVKDTGSSNLTRLKGEFLAEKKDDGPVQLKISIDNGSKMKVIKNGTIFSDIEGKEKGIQYVFNIEDHENLDNDFNDYFISVVTWHKKN